MRSALLLSFFHVIFVPCWGPPSSRNSVSLNYHSFFPPHLDIYVSSLVLFPSPVRFQAPCLFLLRSCHTLSRSWQCDIEYLCLPTTSRADVLNLQVESSHPHQNRHPSLHFAACLCFCSNSGRTNKGSALCLVPTMGLHRWILWLGMSSASLCISAELPSIFHVHISRSREDSAPHKIASISSWAVAT